MGKGVFFLVSCVLALAAVPATAQGNLFWVDSLLSSPNIAGSSLKGGPSQVLVESVNDPGGLTADDQYIYWTSQTTGRIGRAFPDGTGKQEGFIDGLFAPSGIAVSETHIYWSEPFRGYIGRAGLDGSGVNRNFLETQSSVHDLAVEGPYLYWTNGFLVGRASLDGSQINRELINVSALNVSSLGSLATNSSSIFLGVEGRFDGGHIYRANLDGTGLDPDFLTTSGLVEGLTASEGFLYVALRPGSIGRATAQGGDFNPSFITGLAGDPRFLALNNASGQIGSSPSALSFPSQQAGTLSVFRQVEYENTGDEVVRIDGVALDKAEDFLITGDSCPAVLAPEASCRVTVRFAPGSAGEKSDTLRLLTNSEGEKETPLTGVGTVVYGPPSISAVGKPGRANLRVRVSCGREASCGLVLSGGLGRSARPSFPKKQVNVGAGERQTVRVPYGAALRKRISRLLRSGSRPMIIVRARDLTTGKSSRTLQLTLRP